MRGLLAFNLRAASTNVPFLARGFAQSYGRATGALASALPDKTCGLYADIGITVIMPSARLCRMAVVVICAPTVELHAGSA
jgi:hypothetical protein